MDGNAWGGMDTRWVSRSLEVCFLRFLYRTLFLSIDLSPLIQYAFGDFAISQAARALGRHEDEKKYKARSANFENLWNGEVTLPTIDSLATRQGEGEGETVPGIRGFMQVCSLLNDP